MASRKIKLCDCYFCGGSYGGNDCIIDDTDNTVTLNDFLSGKYNGNYSKYMNMTDDTFLYNDDKVKVENEKKSRKE